MARYINAEGNEHIRRNGSKVGWVIIDCSEMVVVIRTYWNHYHNIYVSITFGRLSDDKRLFIKTELCNGTLRDWLKETTKAKKRQRCIIRNYSLQVLYGSSEACVSFSPSLSLLANASIADFLDSKCSEVYSPVWIYTSRSTPWQCPL